MSEKILIIALLVQAIHYTMQEGEIFGKLGNWFYDHLPGKLHPPVFDCPVCMTPYYGSLIYWFIWGREWVVAHNYHDHIFPGGTWIEWIVVVIAAMGLNAVLNKAFPGDSDDDGYYEEDVPERKGSVKNIAA